MGKFIVIQKEKVERSEHSELIKTAISLLIKHGVATELSTDDSIEERAKRYGYSINGDDGIKEFLAYKDAATEQSLIEQIKAKEFAEWCSINSYYYSTASKGWHTPFHIHEFFTTEELFNQFTNQKQ